MKIFIYKGWRVLSAVSESQAQQLFDHVNSDTLKVVQWLKQHHRSDVKLIEFQKNKLVLKIPHEKNTRKWIRYTTLYRDGEAFKNLKSMDLLKKLNIPTTKPVIAAEKRKNGMVVDSWLIYEYLHGESCLDKKEYYSQVIALLSKLHNKGYLHGDPQIRNFITNEKGVHIIDSNPKNPFIKAFDFAYEFAYLSRSAPGIESYFPCKNQPMYRFAKKSDLTERKFSRKKREIRKKVKSRIKKLFSF